MSKKLEVIQSNNKHLYVGVKHRKTGTIINDYLKNFEDIQVLHRDTKEDLTYKLLRNFIHMNSGPEITEALKQFIKENFIGGTKVPDISTPELRSIIQKMEDLEKDNTLGNFNTIFGKEVVGDDSEEVFIFEPVGPSTRRKIKVGLRYFEIDLDTQRNLRSDSANGTVITREVGDIGASVEGYIDDGGVESISIYMKEEE